MRDRCLSLTCEIISANLKNLGFTLKSSQVIYFINLCNYCKCLEIISKLIILVKNLNSTISKIVNIGPTILFYLNILATCLDAKIIANNIDKVPMRNV